MPVVADEGSVTSDRICVKWGKCKKVKGRRNVQGFMPSTVMYLPFSVYSLATAFETLHYRSEHQVHMRKLRSRSTCYIAAFIVCHCVFEPGCKKV